MIDTFTEIDKTWRKDLGGAVLVESVDPSTGETQFQIIFDLSLDEEPVTVEFLGWGMARETITAIDCGAAYWVLDYHRYATDLFSFAEYIEHAK